MKVEDIKSIQIKLASPSEVLSWSHGEVTKPETINYRTQRAEKDGLFCERIFGPTKDYQCYCGKYKGVRYKGVICDRCGVEITRSSVRRERMGHIKLATPVSHIWFLRGVPSRMGMVLGLTRGDLEKVVYFSNYIVTEVDEGARKKILKEIEKEYKQKVKRIKKEEKSQNEEKKGKKKNKKGSKKTESEIEDRLAELKKARNEARKEVMSLKPLQILSEMEYRDFSLKYGEVFEAGVGAETLREIFKKINLKKKIKELKKELQEAPSGKKKKLSRRLKLFRGMKRSGIRPEWMLPKVIPVLPPELRPMVQLDGGRFATSDLNDLYRRVINRNNRLKHLLEINAPEVIVRNEKRMLQEAVDALVDNGMRKTQTTTASTGGRRQLKSLADMLKGKQGRFRQNLLGKRVDYSGRSVIVVGPELKLHQAGIPKKMALELFKPFVINKILDRELAYNVKGATRLIEKEVPEVWEILEEVVKDKLVLLNRAPTLHRLGIQAFYPVLIEGEAIQIHPLVCTAFNADFDGDQMAVHVPLSEEAQQEAREIMLSSVNLLKPATGLPIINPTQDIILGCYWMTVKKEKGKGEGKVFSSPQEAILAYRNGLVDLRAPVKVKISSKIEETTLGRILFNQSLPPEIPFQNKRINSRALGKIITQSIEKYGIDQTRPYLDKIKKLGFEYSTLSGISWGMDDLIVPPQKGEIIKQAEQELAEIDSHYRKGLLSQSERKSQVIELWQGVKSKVEELVPQTLPSEGSVYSMVDSGARGSWTQPVQMAGMKGLVINPLGKIIELPVKSSFKEGFDVLEYFISTHGARKGTVDTALRTAKSGYLTRRLVDVAHDLLVTQDDCKDKKGITVYREDAEDIDQDFMFKILGRIAAKDVKLKQGKGRPKIILKKGKMIDWVKAKEIIDEGVKKVQVRSPLSCRADRGVCRKCYGIELGINQLVEKGAPVGVIAAQAIGEPGTQLTLRTFHTGGVAGGGDITQGLPRVEEIFEARTPKGKAVMTSQEGKVTKVDSDKRIVRIKPQSKKKSKSKTVEYNVPPKRAILVKKGQKVGKGQPLCEGNLDLEKVHKLQGKRKVWRYMLEELQEVYASQGVNIHDKHFEVIIRQMFSRLRIKSPGDTIFTKGEIVEKPEFLEENEELKGKKTKELAKAEDLVLGISKVALTTESFLSSASFQETSRILIDSSVRGKKDHLRGLKENVIIGKLIPAGTGFKSEKDQ